MRLPLAAFCRVIFSVICISILEKKRFDAKLQCGITVQHESTRRGQNITFSVTSGVVKVHIPLGINSPEISMYSD